MSPRPALPHRADDAVRTVVEGITKDEAADPDTLRDAAAILGWWACHLVALADAAATRGAILDHPQLFAVEAEGHHVLLEGVR